MNTSQGDLTDIFAFSFTGSKLQTNFASTSAPCRTVPISKPPLPSTSPTNPSHRAPMGRYPALYEFGSPPATVQPVHSTSSISESSAPLATHNIAAPIHIAQPRVLRETHSQTPANITFMPSSAPELEFAHQANSGSPYSLHLRGQVRTSSHVNLTNLTTVGFQAEGGRGANQSLGKASTAMQPQRVPRSALFGALNEEEIKSGVVCGLRAGQHDLSRQSAGSSASNNSNMSCSPAVLTTALVSRKPSWSSQHSLEMAGTSSEQRSLTFVMASSDSKHLQSHLHSFDPPKWSLPATHDDNLLHGPLRLEHPSCSGHLSTQDGVSPLRAESSAEDPKHTSPFQKEDSLECAMFYFEGDASSRPMLSRCSPSPAMITEAADTQPSTSALRDSSVKRTSWSVRGGHTLQDMTASAPAATLHRSAAESEQELKNFINMLCKADEFTSNTGRQENVVSVQTELVHLSAKWSECM